MYNHICVNHISQFFPAVKNAFKSTFNRLIEITPLMAPYRPKCLVQTILYLFSRRTRLKWLRYSQLRKGLFIRSQWSVGVKRIRIKVGPRMHV